MSVASQLYRLSLSVLKGDGNPAVKNYGYICHAAGNLRKRSSYLTQAMPAAPSLTIAASPITLLFNFSTSLCGDTNVPG